MFRQYSHLPLLTALAFALPLAVATGNATAGDERAGAILKYFKQPQANNPVLSRMVGRWRGEGILKGSRMLPEQDVVCKLSAEMIMDNKLLRQKVKCNGILISFKQTTYLGFDEGRGSFLGMAFGNLGPDTAALEGTGDVNGLNLTVSYRKAGKKKLKRNSLKIRVGDQQMSSLMTKISSRPYRILDVAYYRR
jgi:hypothetical protein